MKWTSDNNVSDIREVLGGCQTVQRGLWMYQLMPKFLPSKWANDHNIFFSISGSRLNFKNPLTISLKTSKGCAMKNFKLL